MTYLNFTKITPAAPNDPKVDEQAQLNANWDLFDLKTGNVTTPTVNIPTSELDVGQELIRANRLQVWTGTLLKTPVNVNTAWTAWASIPNDAGVSAVAGNVLKWRSNPQLKQVELYWLCFFGAVPGPWPASFVPITADSVSGIPLSFKPFGSNTTYMHCSTSGDALGTGRDAMLRVQAGTNAVMVHGRYMGPVETQALQLTNVRWFYG